MLLLSRTKKLFFITRSLVILCAIIASCEKKTTIDSAKSQFISGINLLKNKQFPQAIETFQALQDQFPELAPVEYLLAGCYFHSGDLQNATLKLEKAISHYPDYQIAIALKARIHFLQKEFTQALALYNTAIKLTPTIPKSIGKYTTSPFLKELLTTSVHSFKPEDDDIDTRITLDRAKIYELQDNYSQAIQTISTYMADHETKISALKRARFMYELSKLHAFMGHTVKSLNLANKAVSIYFTEKYATHKQAVTRLFNNEITKDDFKHYTYALDHHVTNPAKALTFLKQIFTPFPESNELAGKIYLQMDDLHSAQDAFKKAIQGDPTTRYARLMLAQLLARKHMYPDSLHHINRLIELGDANESQLLAIKKDIQAKQAVYALVQLYLQRSNHKAHYAKQSRFYRSRYDIAAFQRRVEMNNQQYTIVGATVKRIDTWDAYAKATLELIFNKSGQLDRTTREMHFTKESGDWYFVASEDPEIEELYLETFNIQQRYR